jgi:PilZ domain
MSAIIAFRRWMLSLSARRRHPRIESKVPVEWHVFGSAVRHLSRLGDLSIGGAFLRTPAPKPVGSPIVLDLAAPRGSVTVHARVAWTAPTGMGLRFTTT